MASPKRRRRPWLWLVMAVALLGVGAFVMRSTEPPEREPPPEVNLPTRMTPADVKRAFERRTWLPQPTFDDAGVQVVEPVRPRDPLQALAPAQVKHGVLVAEVNAIMNSEVGQLLMDCAFSRRRDALFLSQLRDAGIDPMQTIDRIAMMEESLVMTGSFKGVEWSSLFRDGTTAQDFGPNAKLFSRSPGKGGDSMMLWKDQLVMFGEDEAELKAMVDRLEGKGVAEQPVIHDSLNYGEMYGVLSAAFFADRLLERDPALSEVIRSAAKDVQLHVDVGHDVGLVADVKPNETQATDQLRRSLASALSLARLKAQTEGNTRSAQVLDLARVADVNEKSGTFRLEAGLPHDVMVEALRECAERAKKEE